jgi:acetyltransferase-like isoleucine patch superfamily enzyme
MSFLPLRPVPVAHSAGSLYEEWLVWLREALDDPGCDRNELCTTVLTDLYYPGLSKTDVSGMSISARVALAQMDPRNVTLEPEYYQELDERAYGPRKPLLWLWEMFDRSALGENVELGIHFRRILAGHVFGSCASVSDFANVYSHSHNIVDGRIVYLPKTVIGRGARITYHATILAGTHVAEDSMVGAGSMLTKSTEPHWVYVGVPARKVKEKSAEERANKAPPSVDPMADE